MSRRRALRLFGGALVSGVLATIPGVALGQNRGGNSACAHFCNMALPGATELRGVCKSTAAHGEGLCPQCDADPRRICSQPSAPEQLRCCPEGETCCGTSACCDPGQVCCFNQPNTQGQNRCCPQNTLCCGTGACCAAGETCCPTQNRCLRCGPNERPDPVNCRCEPIGVRCPEAPGGVCPPQTTCCPRASGPGAILGACCTPLAPTCCTPTVPGGPAMCCPPNFTCCRGRVFTPAVSCAAHRGVNARRTRSSGQCAASSYNREAIEGAIWESSSSRNLTLMLLWRWYCTVPAP